MMFKTVLVYTFLLCGVALHGSCTSTCSCGDPCANDEAAMPCLYHANFPALTAGRGINEAVCSYYDVYNGTEESYCDFVGTHAHITDICPTDGSSCIMLNPGQVQQNCQRERYYCNYLMECPPTKLLWVHCISMNLPDYYNNECMDEVSFVSDFLPNGVQSVCGSSCFSLPIIIPFLSLEIEYGASSCCHNEGFDFLSFCSDSMPDPSLTKRAATTDPCLEQRITVVPMDGKLQYDNNTIRVSIPSQRNNTLTYNDIEVLFVEDKRWGNSIYTGTGFNVLRGYGELEIIGYVAYYRYYTIDPSLMPNAEETEYITKSVHLLNDVMKQTAYSNFTRGYPESSLTYNTEQLQAAKQDAYQRQFSSNIFVSGIAKDLIKAVDPLLATDISPTSSVVQTEHPIGRQPKSKV